MLDQYIKNQKGTGNWEEPSSNVICSSTLLWNPSLCISSLTLVVPVWLNFKVNSWAPVLQLAVSLTALPAALKDNESRLSDWPLYPWVNERASAELTPVSWFPPREPGVVLSPRLNYVWTLHKQHNNCTSSVREGWNFHHLSFNWTLFNLNTGFIQHERAQCQRRTSQSTANPETFSSPALSYRCSVFH